MRLPLLAAATFAAVAISSPASAISLSTAQVGTIFCIGRLSGDMAPVIAILTDELAALVAAAPSPDAVPWQGEPDYANICEPIGATGTVDAPQAVLSYRYRDPAMTGYSDRLVLRWVDGRVRIDDIIYGKGGTLREELSAGR
jgi:hypothetical protein